MMHTGIALPPVVCGKHGFLSPRRPASLSGYLTVRRTDANEHRKRNKEKHKGVIEYFATCRETPKDKIESP